MLIGVPKEVKSHEYRVGLTPGSVREIVHHGHEVVVETGAGTGIGFEDASYEAVGARILPSKTEVFAAAELLVKVKEPQPPEAAALREGQVLFTYLHLAADKVLAQALVRSGVTAIAYETVTDARGGLPLLAPMSEVAGRMAVQVGAHCLEKEQGGIGVLLGGVPGVPAAKVVILGGGVSGTNAARMAMGMEAYVTVIDRSLPRLYELDLQFGAQLHTLFSTMENIEREVTAADLVIGAVLIPGAAAPKLVSRALVRAMKPGAVVVDISIDQGGCFETSKPTTHAAPTYVEDGRRPLLCDEYAGGGCPHLDCRAQQRDPAVCAGTRRSRLAACSAPRRASAKWPEHLPGANHPSCGCARSGAPVHIARTNRRRSMNFEFRLPRYGLTFKPSLSEAKQAGKGGYGAPSDHCTSAPRNATRGVGRFRVGARPANRGGRDRRGYRALP